MVQYARYRAPAESGQKLIAPPWDQLCRIAAENRKLRKESTVVLLGEPLANFGAAARHEILQRAVQYVGTYAPVDLLPADAAARPLIVAGHQPELAHPGVWVKHFAAAALCASKGALSLNLIIDGDVSRGTTIRVPTGTIDDPRQESIEFDAPAAEMPWEERRIVDVGRWRSFADRVRAATSSLLSARMLDHWWPLAIERGTATGRIGLAIAQARHLAEIAWGRYNLELPQSQMCCTTAFRRFTLHLLIDLQRFVAAYNEGLGEYRQAHRLRDRSHPAPDLTQNGPWLEAPYWIWTADDPRRRAVFVRHDADGLLVSDRRLFERKLPLTSERATDDALEELDRWEAAGVKLRSRALITTMFARLAIADLFIHGIGGAKYDEATDAICERFFGAPPPMFAAISGTLRLPVSQTSGNGQAIADYRQRLRELTYHPERFLDATAADDEAARLAAYKRRWIAAPKTPGVARQRHREIAGANQALQPFVASQRAELDRRLAAAIRQVHADRILNSREYPFCLYPQKLLEQFLLDFPA